VVLSLSYYLEAAEYFLTWQAIELPHSLVPAGSLVRLTPTATT